MLGATLLKERAKMASRNPFAKDLSGTPIVADSVTTVSVQSNVFAAIAAIFFNCAVTSIMFTLNGLRDAECHLLVKYHHTVKEC